MPAVSKRNRFAVQSVAPVKVAPVKPLPAPRAPRTVAGHPHKNLGAWLHPKKR